MYKVISQIRLTFFRKKIETEPSQVENQGQCLAGRCSGALKETSKDEVRKTDSIRYSETLKDYVFRLNHIKLPTLTRNF